MNNKNVQKLNRAAVAAVLAASGAAVTMPYSVVKADSPFSDVTTSNSHYDSIMKLYNRGIISGFEDKTFRPSQEVTRGQAAKMLALTLGLDIHNVKNPKFKDVPSTSGYYPYIAALVEQGAISGYVDNTFRPGEVITRNQMAKIIVKGFQFGETTNLTHKFEDVSNKNANRFYIQTLVNLGITTGTSAIAFSPNKAVTRAQLSSFLVRAEEANVYGAKVKEITKIEQKSGVTYIYLNGVKHTVNTSLRDILNVKNTETLKGAHIEGTIVGSEIRTLNKITFNAVGAQNNVLTFDGNGSTYRGAVEITGNHLRFSNWTVTGEVTIASAQTQAISNLHKPLTVKTIASLKVASDLIDWDTQTPPSQIEPGGNDGLIEIPPNNKPVLPKMKAVEHDIQFVNVKMRALVITANRTKIRSNVDLAHVTVGGYVREFELHTDVKELYIESDDNVTFYGVADIEKLYKNSYKSVNLYADSVTQLIAVDNASGWIDLGDYYYVDKFIIPPKTLPHDIFNDFINDSDKIGDIKDPGGKDVDREPIENGIVPDWEAPILTIKNAQTNLATVNVTVNSNEDGIVHYLVKREKDGEPSIREIMQYTGPMGGTKAVSEGQDAIITVTDLKDQEKYIIYAVAVDEAGNVSKKVSEAFEIKDATPPSITPVTAEGLPGGTRIKVTMNPNEAGEYYYYYDRLITQARQYTTEEILKLVEDRDAQAGKGTVTEAGKMDFRITGLLANTSYVVYVVMKDKAGNVMSEPVMVSAMTGVLDLTPPRIEGKELYQDRNNPYEFYFNVTEELDPVTANNPNNYELSGTAILNIEGRPTTIKPEYVKYEAGSKKVTIRVPSATALVNGDTIQVKALPGVTDLAENAFSNIDNEPSIEAVSNTATYNHSDVLEPRITNQELIISPDKKNGYLKFNANKAGTYYYMIVADDFDWTGLDKEDFYDDFVKNPNPGLFPLGTDNVLSKYGDERNNAVLVGTQPQITIPIPQTVNPFKNYSLYLIMRDRSGNLSNMIDMPIIYDKKAPFIDQFTVEPKEGSNTIVNLKVGSSEAGKLYYKRVPKYEKDPSTGEILVDASGQKQLNRELLEMQSKFDANETTLRAAKDNLRLSDNAIIQNVVREIEGSWTQAALNEGLTEYEHSGLNPHEEYVYYLAVEDMAGNLTLFPEKTPITNPKDYTDSLMIQKVYTDGIAPKIDGKLELIRNPVFKKITLGATTPTGTKSTIGDGQLTHIPQRTFVLTFSEQIQHKTSNELMKELELFLESKLSTAATSVDVLDMEWEKTNTLKSWEPRRLVFTVDNLPTTDITITIDDLVNFTDLLPSGKAFSAGTDYKAKWPDSNEIRFSILEGDVKGDPVSGTYYSDTVHVAVELNVRNDVKQTYYYATQNSGGSGINSAEDVVNAVLNRTDLITTGLGVTGFGNLIEDITLDPTQIPSQTLEIVTNGGHFFTDQKIYIVTMDEYGNIVSLSSTRLFDIIRHTP